MHHFLALEKVLQERTSNKNHVPTVRIFLKIATFPKVVLSQMKKEKKVNSHADEIGGARVALFE